MKYIKFAYHMFCSRFMMNLLVIIQLAVSFSLLHGMITYTADEYTTVTAFEPLSRLHGIHFASPLSELPDSLFEQIQQIDDDIDRITGVTEYSYGNSVTYYSPAFVKYYQPRISEGIWFTEYQAEGKTTIPVVSFGKYRIGDLIETGEDGLYYEVIGITNEPFYFSFDAYGYQTNTNLVMQPSNTERLLSVITDTVQENLDIFAFKHDNCYVFISDSDDFVEPAKAILQEYGYVSTFSEVRDYGIQQASEMTRVFLPFFIFMFILSILGLVGCISFTVIKHLKMFSVLFLVGGTRRECIGIVSCYIALLMACALLIFRLLSLVLFTQALASTFATLSSLGILLMCILTMCTAIVPVIILKNNQPLDAFKKAD